MVITLGIVDALIGFDLIVVFSLLVVIVVLLSSIVINNLVLIIRVHLITLAVKIILLLVMRDYWGCLKLENHKFISLTICIFGIIFVALSVVFGIYLSMIPCKCASFWLGNGFATSICCYAGPP